MPTSPAKGKKPKRGGQDAVPRVSSLAFGAEHDDLSKIASLEPSALYKSEQEKFKSKAPAEVANKLPILFRDQNVDCKSLHVLKKYLAHLKNETSKRDPFRDNVTQLLNELLVYSTPK